MLAIDQLDLQAGERLAVLGHNGAGKTTLLRLLAGLDAPTTGSVAIDGEPIAGADLELRRSVAYATQRPGLLATSVIRNVELPLRWRGIDRRARRSAALDALERLNVASLAARNAGSLSGGEAQRVSLARALAIEPQLLLLDEPAAGLDAEARGAFFDDLEHALRDRAATIVHVSHRAEEALRLADSVAALTDGAIRQLSDPASIVRQPADATVARLVGYENVLPVADRHRRAGAHRRYAERPHHDDGPGLRDPRRLGNRDPPRFTRQRAAARDRGTRVAGTGTLGDRARRQRETPRPSALRPDARPDPGTWSRYASIRRARS